MSRQKIALLKEGQQRNRREGNNGLSCKVVVSITGGIWKARSWRKESSDQSKSAFHERLKIIEWILEEKNSLVIFLPWPSANNSLLAIKYAWQFAVGHQLECTNWSKNRCHLSQNRIRWRPTLHRVSPFIMFLSWQPERNWFDLLLLLHGPGYTKRDFPLSKLSPH